MKKIFSAIIVVALAALSQTSFGQAQVALGLKGGLNFSKFDISEGASNVKNQTGFNVGAFGLIKFAKFGIQPEILLSKQGSNFKDVTSGGDFAAKFDYINIPILFKLYLAAGLNLEVGPQFAFLSKSDLTYTIGGIKTTQDVKDQLSKKSDTALALGIGWDLPFGLVLDARYNLGLSDFKFNVGGSGVSPSIKNKVIQLTVGYKFIKLGK